MRLDKFISENNYTRKEGIKLIKNSCVSVNGIIVNKKDYKLDENSDIVVINGKTIVYDKYIYIMINKPAGVLSATEDRDQDTIIDLLPDLYKNRNLFPVGRLDKDTVGLLLLTNDGEFCHKMTSPKYCVNKTYYFELADEISTEDVSRIENGIILKDEYETKPCKIVMNNSKNGTIIITEGKYHQVKRMFAATGNKVEFLKRMSEGQIILDNNLAEGEFRLLTIDEMKATKQ